MSAFAHQPFCLTPAQEMRLENLPADSVVVGAAEDCPLVRSSLGRLMRVDHDGAIKRASALQRRMVQHRAIDLLFPRSH